MKERCVKEALKELSWPLIQAELTAAIDDACFTELLGHMRRSPALIVERPDIARETRRDDFLAAFRSFAGGLGQGFADRAAALEHNIRQIEAGYRGILDALGTSAVAVFTPAERIAGLLQTIEQLYKQIVAASERQVKRNRTFAHAFLLQDEDGRLFNADGALTAMIEVMSMTLKMEAYGSGWFDTRGQLVLPSLPTASEDLVRLSGVTAELANWWRRWQRTETRLRFLGGEIVARDPASAPEGVTTVLEYRPQSEIEELDYIANERLNDRLTQTYLEMLTQSPLASLGRGIDNPLPIDRGNIVSDREGHAAVTLCEILAYDIMSSDERPGDLRIVEWLRGYAVLHAIAEREFQRDAAVYLPVLDREQLLATLERCGLSAEAATVFLDRVTFRRKSWDLFDHPLIRRADGRYLLFGPAILAANLARVTLSAIANLEVQLARKGTAFEGDMRRRLKAQPGLSVYAFTAHRDGAEYEYDAIVVWGGYLFVLECKNHSLSGHDPARAYYFDLETRSHVRQVQRLVRALKAYPDILDTQIGPHAHSLQIVPCVVNSLPFSVPGGIDGVYFTDASALKKFFETRYLRQIASHGLPKNVKLIHRSALMSLWEGDAPTPQDLLRQLESPFQVALIRAHMESGLFSFGIGPTAICVSQGYARRPPTPESIAAFTGANLQVLREETRQMTRLAAAIRKKYARDQRVADDRSWRKRVTANGKR